MKVTTSYYALSTDTKEILKYISFNSKMTV